MKTSNFFRNNKNEFKAMNYEFAIINRKTIKTSSSEFMKYLFLNDKNVDVTKNFLSTIMNDVFLPKIKAIQLHTAKPFKTTHNEIFNLSALDEKGQFYNIEIMNENDDDCIKRSMFYWAKRFTATSYDGKNFNGITPTVSITITDKILFEEKNKFHWCFLPYDIQNRLVSLDNHQQIHFIELAKFNVEKDDDYISYLSKGNYPVTEDFFAWMLFFREGWRKDFLKQYTVTNPYITTAKEDYEKFILQHSIKG